MIVLTIKSYFFSKVNNYNLGQKLYISSFFLLFYKKIIKIVDAMLVRRMFKVIQICQREKAQFVLSFWYKMKKLISQWLMHYIT